MVLVYSATKGLAAMTLAIAHSRGWLDYEERVRTYWPEFAQQGKEKITVRQLLAHQAGLFAFDEPVDRSVVADLDRLAVVLARQKPAWEPGTRQAYHAITLGFYEGELLRRVDPQHRSLGQFFQDEIATPLGLDVYIRLPEEIPNSRLATLAPPRPIDMLLGFPLRLTLDAMNRRSNIYRALMTNPGFAVAHDEQRVYARNLEVPSGGAVGTARAIAHAYGVFATGGRELGLRQETLDLLAAPAIPPTRGFYDECLKGDGAVLAGLHEAESRLAVRQRALVRLSGIRRLSRLCRSGGRHWIRVRDQPDGNAIDRRPARCRAQRRALLGSPSFVRGCIRGRKEGIMTTIKAFIARHPMPAYFVLTFAISWGAVLMVIGGPGGIPGGTAQSDPLFPFVYLAMLAGPSVAGILLTGLVNGRAGLREFRSRLLKWHVGAAGTRSALLTAPLLIMATLFALSLHFPDVSPRHIHVSRQSVAPAVRDRSGAGGRFLRGNRVDGIRRTRTEVSLQCRYYRSHSGSPVGRMAFSGGRLGNRQFLRGASASPLRAPGPPFFPAALPGADGVDLRPYREPARCDAHARESHKQHADHRSCGDIGRPPLDLRACIRRRLVGRRCGDRRD